MANEIEKIKEFSFLSVLDEGYGKEVATAADGLKAIKQVTNDAEARTANAALKAAKAVWNIVHHAKTGRRIEITRELDALKKRIIAAADESTKLLDEPMETVNRLLADYAERKLAEQRKAEEKERKRREAEAAAAAEAAAKEAEMAAKFGGAGAEAPEPEQPAQSADAPEVVEPEVVEPEVVEPEVVETQKKKPVVAGVTVRTTWTFSVDDPDAVPREFCKPDEVLIRQYMQNAKANGAKLETLHIAGVTFTEKVSV